jgi:hypothetical protein
VLGGVCVGAHDKLMTVSTKDTQQQQGLGAAGVWCDSSAWLPWCVQGGCVEWAMCRVCNKQGP